jgi:hypothetical protein
MNTALDLTSTNRFPPDFSRPSICRKGGRGFPQAVLQEEVKARTEQIKVRGTVKAAVLEGNATCPNWLQYWFMIPNQFTSY